MAISMRMRWDGVTADQYDKVREAVGWERDRAAGGILHVAWFVDDQLNVCDIWDSADDFDKFVGQRLMPGVAQIGIVGQPEVKVLPLYSWQLEQAPAAGAVVGDDEIPLEAFQALEGKVAWRSVPPAGGVCLIAGIEGPLARLVTVFESEAAVEAFERDRIGPAAAELGFPAEAVAPGAMHPLHAFFDAADTLSPTH